MIQKISYHKERISKMVIPRTEDEQKSSTHEERENEAEIFLMLRETC